MHIKNSLTEFRLSAIGLNVKVIYCRYPPAIDSILRLMTEG